MEKIITEWKMKSKGVKNNDTNNNKGTINI